MQTITLNVATLEGPLPDFSEMSSLSYCDFTPSQLCLIPGSPAQVGQCSFKDLPTCEWMETPDCLVLSEWMPDLFPRGCCDGSLSTCTTADGVLRITALNIAFLNGVSLFERQSGVISEKIGDLTELTAIDLSNNLFHGEIPESFENLLALTVLRLNGNILFGLIPTEVCEMASLHILNLRSNQLYGPVPSCLTKLDNLVEILLSDNRFTGMMPYIEDIKVVDIVSNNGLVEYSGPVPDTQSTTNSTYSSIGGLENPGPSFLVSITIAVLCTALVFILLITIILFLKKRTKKKREREEQSSYYTSSEIAADPMDDFGTFRMDEMNEKGGMTISSMTTGASSSGRKQIVWGSKLSSGAFGIVWRGTYDGKEVAIKSMSNMADVNSSTHLRFIERFISEAKIMLIMKHERVGLSFISLTSSRVHGRRLGLVFDHHGAHAIRQSLCLHSKETGKDTVD
jgi:hypothetical protein